MTKDTLAALRAQAEDAAIWQDQWDSPSSDGTAVGDWIDTASPRLVLDLLDEVERGRKAQAAVVLIVARHHTPDDLPSCDVCSAATRG